MSRNDFKFSWLGITRWHKAGITGQGVKIAIHDRDFDFSDARYPERLRAIGSAGSRYQTTNGVPDRHGQMVVDVIQQVAPDAEIHFAQTFYNGDRFIGECIDREIDVVSISTDYISESIRSSKEAADNGILMFGSAGNSGIGSKIAYPARLEDFIAVGAATVTGYGEKPRRSSYSTTGTELEVMGMTTILVNSGLTFTGTSCASPMIAGMAALCKQKYKDITLSGFRSLIEKHSVNMNLDGKDTVTGWGMFRLPNPESGERMKEIVLHIGNNVASVDGEPITIDAPPEISNNRTMVPLSFIARELGHEVEWDGESRRVIIRR